MRKIISIFLLLIMASVASATTVTLVPIGEGEPGSATNPLQPSDSIYIWVTTDSPLIALNAILTITSGPGWITDAIDPPGFGIWPCGWDPSLSFYPIIVPPPPYGKSVEIGLGSFSGTLIGKVAWIEITCDGPGTVVVDLSPGMSFGGSGDVTLMPPIIEGTLTIHQIPEPLTIALLGLGGLSLLRRRK